MCLLLIAFSIGSSILLTVQWMHIVSKAPGKRSIQQWNSRMPVAERPVRMPKDMVEQPVRMPKHMIEQPEWTHKQTTEQPKQTELEIPIPAATMPAFMYDATEQAKQNRRCAKDVHPLESVTDFRAKLEGAAAALRGLGERDSRKITEEGGESRGEGEKGTPSTRKRKIVHLAMYDCELTMLELKLTEMGPAVFKFVIGEASMSNSNKPRRACFHEALANSRIVQHYMSIGKIDYIFMDNKVDEGEFMYWEAEVHYKNQLSGPVARAGLDDDDLILLSDMDEIVGRPYLEAMSESMPANGGIRLALRWTYYGFQWVNPGLTVVNAIVTWGDLKGRCAMQANNIRLNLCGGEANMETWGTVGWHCSWCIPTMQFIEKLDKTSASEMNTPSNRHLDFLTQQREQGLWFMTQTPNGCFAERGDDTLSFSPRVW